MIASPIAYVEAVMARSWSYTSAMAIAAVTVCVFGALVVWASGETAGIRFGEA